MKKILIITMLNMVLFSPYMWSELSQKEVAFINATKPNKEITKIINEIFSNLDQKLLDLLDGKDPVTDPDKYEELFKQAGFTIYNLRTCQNKNFRIDSYPKRAILKHKKLPDFFIKIGFDLERPQKNISRVLHAEAINSLIDDPVLNITTIKKIHKKLCPRPKRSSDDLLDINYIVLSPEQKGIPALNKVVTIEQDGKEVRYLKFDTKKQIIDCALLRNILQQHDIVGTNILFTEDEKIVFIDTEIIQDEMIQSFLEKML